MPERKNISSFLGVNETVWLGEGILNEIPEEARYLSTSVKIHRIWRARIGRQGNGGAIY